VVIYSSDSDKVCRKSNLIEKKQGKSLVFVVFGRFLSKKQRYFLFKKVFLQTRGGYFSGGITIKTSWTINGNDAGFANKNTTISRGTLSHEEMSDT
jgi:hypothetical protein